jgi:probable DNA metabolism protein
MIVKFFSYDYPVKEGLYLRDLDRSEAPVGAECIAYVYDGTFEGLMTAVFESYAKKEMPAVICENDNIQMSLCYSPVLISTDPVKAGRVIDGIVHKIGDDIYNNIWTAFLSCDPDRSDKIFRYIRYGFDNGNKIHIDLTCGDVSSVLNICRAVNWELNKYSGFLRFSVMKNGVQYAEFAPKNNLIPIIMPHFTDRFHSIPFIIHDVERRTAGIYDTHESYITVTEGLRLPEYSQDEQFFRELWRQFYETISIEERRNHKLRNGHLPKRYRRFMTENSL